MSSLSKSSWRLPGSFLEGTFVEPGYQRTDAVVELGEREEDLVPESGLDPAFDVLNTNFRLRLVSGFSGTGRYHSNLIILSKLLIGGIQFGIVTTGFATPYPERAEFLHPDVAEKSV